MNFNRKEHYRNIATETLDIINKGYYINKSNEKVNIKELAHKAVESTELIEKWSSLDISKKAAIAEQEHLNSDAKAVIINKGTVDTIIELRNQGLKGNIIALNFASAKNPGGGFQTGANAQEESIARASALYPCLLKCKEFYDYHKAQGNPLYSDKMIYSPNVPIFREDKGNLLESPILGSIITSPAVNARVAREGGVSELEIKENMRSRIRRILQLAFSKQPEAVILGAFGCGVFGNNIGDVAQIFQLELSKYKYEKVKVIFAIYDKDEKIINEFKKYLHR